VIKWIVTSSILIAVIITLRHILKGKISLRLQYALWGLALLRLLIPFSIGSSGFSVMNTVQKVPVVQDLEIVKDVGNIWHTESGSVEGYPSYELMPETPVTVAENKTEAEFTRMEKVLTLREAFRKIWLCGAAILFFAFAVSNRRFASRVRRTRKPLTGKASPLPVYITDETDTPCLFGLFRPAIYVTPESAEDATILRHTVEHETTHFRHGDHFWSVLQVVCLALHWYNPLVWWAAALSRNDAELACDEATIRRIGEAERAEYGRTLIGMTCQKRTALLITATTMTGSKGSIRERIMLIAKKPKMAVYTLIAVVLIAAVAVGCTFTGAKNEQENFSPDTVSMAQMLSSSFHPDPITDAETVEYLWSLYQGFEFDGTAETLDKENVWSISVAFSSSESGESESFTIFQGGLCQLGDDYETYHILLDGADIYNEFLSYFEAAKKSTGSIALTDIFTTLTNEQTPVRLTLTVEGKVVGGHNGWGCGNDIYLSNRLSDYTYEVISTKEMPAEGQKITLMSTAAGDDWSVDFYEGSDYIRLESGGETSIYSSVPKEAGPGRPSIGTILRMWFDEAEWQDIGGSYETQGQIVIPDEGQDYLTAAKEYCEAFEGKHLTATSGSEFCYTFVSCQTKAADDATALFRENGEIDENTYAFYLTTVFVPENDRARDWSMAGNTGEYTGTDPNVPEGAYEYGRCGYITLSDDGWHGNLVGTGW